jgi:predicted nucleotidyltransferase
MIAAATDFAGLVRRLLECEVEFIIVGGLACNVHGAGRATYDVDVVYARSSRNIARLVEALAPISPYLRGAPPGLPFIFDAKTIAGGLNFTLSTKLGDIDLLGEVVGGGAYDRLLASTEEIDLFGFRCRCVTLEGLIYLKRAAGRPKDLEVIAELEAIAEERSREQQRE